MLNIDGGDTAPPRPACVRSGPGERVRERLGATGYLALRRIDCECTAGVLFLRGWVPTYYLKQVAQAVADRVEGVVRVDNQIRVHGSSSGRTLPGDR